MRTRSKLVLAGLTATLLMSIAVSSASANRLSISNRNIRITWTSLDFTDSDGDPLIECPVTLEGSFHSATIRKVRGALIGFISRGSVRGAQATGQCTGGTATIQQTSLPWHITYDSFEGTLPRPAGVWLLLHRVAFRVSIFGVACLYRENGAERARGRVDIEPNGLVTGVTPDEEIRLPRFEGSFLCPEEGGFREVGRVTLLGNTTNIRVTLI